jgi:hypothetical protein
MDQKRGSMNKNRLRRREGWTSEQNIAKSMLIKARQRKVGDRAWKEVWLIWGDLGGAMVEIMAEGTERSPDHPSEVSRGRSSEEGRETGLSEGPNGAPEWALTRGGQVIGPRP